MSFFPVLVGDPLNPLWDVRKMGRDMSCPPSSAIPDHTGN